MAISKHPDLPEAVDDRTGPDHGPDLPTTVIATMAVRPAVNLGEVWRARELLFILAWRDVMVKYKQTAFGAAWAVFQPASMMVVLTLFFWRMARVSAGGLPYPLFAFAGLLPWTFFATAVAGSGNSVVDSEPLITKVYFPRLAIPFAAVAASVVDFAVACCLLVGMMAFYRVPPSANLWLAPAVFALIVLAAAGIGTLLAALNVAYRDVRYVIPFLLQIWMFATPTVYMDVGGTATRGLLKTVMALNPMTGLIHAFRSTVLGGPMPWGSLVASAGVSAGLFLAGCLYFRRVEDRFADII